MRRILEVIGGIVAGGTIIGGIAGFTNYWIESKRYVTEIQVTKISREQIQISDLELKRDIFYVNKRLKSVDDSILVIREDVKSILKLMLNK